MTPALLREVAAEANLAPSVHNTQPVRWQRDGDGVILELDPGRRLPIGDPSGQDARLSGGAAMLGTRFALARRGIGVAGVDLAADSVRIAVGGEGETAPEASLLQRRTSFRAGFSAADPRQATGLAAALQDRPDAVAVTSAAEIAQLAELNDHASLKVMRGRAFRTELLAWMRLSPAHPNWSRDGLSADALAMGRLEAIGAGVVLRPPVFEALAALGLARPITAEAAKTRSATALVVFHRAVEEDRWTSGAAFYALWLALTELGFAAWPMAVLADDPEARAEVSALARLSDDREVISVLRVGPHPGAQQPTKARLPAEALIKEA